MSSRPLAPGSSDFDFLKDEISKLHAAGNHDLAKALRDHAFVVLEMLGRYRELVLSSQQQANSGSRSGVHQQQQRSVFSQHQTNRHHPYARGSSAGAPSQTAPLRPFSFKSRTASPNDGWSSADSQ